jgi:hypothetical protein
MNFYTNYATLVIPNCGEIEELIPVKLHYQGRKLLWVEEFEEDMLFVQFFPLVDLQQLAKAKVPVYCVRDVLSFTPDPEGGEGIYSVREEWGWSYPPQPKPVVTDWDRCSSRLKRLTKRNLRKCLEAGDRENFVKLLTEAVRMGFKTNKKSSKAFRKFLYETPALDTAKEVKETRQEKEMRKKELKKLKNAKAKNSKRKGKKPWREH